MSWLFFIRCPKYWNFSITPSNEYSGLISFRMDWFDFILAVQEILNSLLQHHSLKESILQLSAFFMVELSHLYMTTGKSVCVCTRAHVRLVTQSCLTLCDPRDCSPPSSSVHGDSPGKNTGVSCHALLQGIEC